MEVKNDPPMKLLPGSARARLLLEGPPCERDKAILEAGAIPTKEVREVFLEVLRDQMGTRKGA